jgi:hypothetical protein
MFHFADLDRDGMIDMLYTSKNAALTQMELSIHYNRLLNLQKEIDSKNFSAFGYKNICASTTRPINMIKNIFLALGDSVDFENTSLIQKIVIAEGEERIEMFDPHPTHMPGNLKIGDITSDGFPDILMTIKKGNST